jgi:hypothetical protein
MEGTYVRAYVKTGEGLYSLQRLPDIQLHSIPSNIEINLCYSNSRVYKSETLYEEVNSHYKRLGCR